mgnify:CR=1 FL=1
MALSKYDLKYDDEPATYPLTENETCLKFYDQISEILFSIILKIIDNEMNSIFNNFSEKDEKFVSYYVHIVRENDNIDTICLKYGVSVEKIKEYNNIDQIALGSKIIIPYIVNEAI